VTEWTPLSRSKARKEVNKRRRHFNMSKTGFISQMGNDPRRRTRAMCWSMNRSRRTSRTLAIACALGRRPIAWRFLAHDCAVWRSKPELDQLVGEFTGVFTNADGNLFVETYNQLNAYFATVPGNYAQSPQAVSAEYQLRRPVVSLYDPAGREDERASRLRVPGRARNGQQHAVLPQPAQRRSGAHAHPRNDRERQKLFCNFILQNAQKYAPLTFIFDIGGSFQSLTTIFGGAYLNVGQEARDFTINPFSLPPSKENLQFLFSFFRVLIEGNDSVTGSTSKKSASCGMRSSGCMCWSPSSARSPTSPTSSAS
jgi:hypothetical protein